MQVIVVPQDHARFMFDFILLFPSNQNRSFFCSSSKFLYPATS